MEIAPHLVRIRVRGVHVIHDANEAFDDLCTRSSVTIQQAGNHRRGHVHQLRELTDVQAVLLVPNPDPFQRHGDVGDLGLGIVLDGDGGVAASKEAANDLRFEIRHEPNCQLARFVDTDQIHSGVCKRCAGPMAKPRVRYNFLEHDESLLNGRDARHSARSDDHAE